MLLRARPPCLGLRTVIYPAPDLAAGKDWWSRLLGIGPNFDQPFYVGYQVAGYELALDPHADPGSAPVTYWGVADAAAALAGLLAAGSAPHSDGVTDVGDGVTDVGDGIRVATVREVGGSLLGIIENPNFSLPETSSEPPDGPGR